MVATEFVKARLSLDLKQRVKALSDRQLLSESAWLKRLVVREVQAAEGAETEGSEGVANLGVRRSKEREPQTSSRVYVRLRKDDWLLLEARAAARGMRPATYVSALTRSHLRQLSPLPKDELITLRRSINELAAIGRNLNQIARSANEGSRLPSSAREDFRAMLKVCEGLRDNTRALLKANLTSWKSGYGENV